MTNKFVFTVLAGLMLLSGAAHAQRAILNANNQVSLAIGSHSLDYREDDKAGITGTATLDSEKGSQNAYQLSVTSQGKMGAWKNMYFQAELQSATGTTAYDGYLQGGGVLVPYQSTTDSNVNNFVVRVGRGFLLDPLTQVTPFVGMGTRTWVRDMTPSPYGYKETYKHRFVELGILGKYAFDPKLVGSASLSLGSTFDANMTAELGSNLGFKLGAAPVSTFKLGLDYAIDRQWHLNAGISQTDFKYGESPLNQGYFEPSSSTQVRAFYLGAGVQF